jgi:hypothetical protein
VGEQAVWTRHTSVVSPLQQRFCPYSPQNEFRTINLEATISTPFPRNLIFRGSKLFQ